MSPLPSLIEYPFDLEKVCLIHFQCDLIRPFVQVSIRPQNAQNIGDTGRRDGLEKSGVYRVRRSRSDDHDSSSFEPTEDAGKRFTGFSSGLGYPSLRSSGEDVLDVCFGYGGHSIVIDLLVFTPKPT